ncbi:MAG: MFS transporter [Pseudonocardiaceae bacterium]|nr:MFS transporter [Pseudonocardiaceae bacterium]
MLSVLLLASTLGVMGGAIVVPVLEVIRGDLGVSGTASGFIITAHGLAIALASPLMGRLIDRFGVRVPMVGGLVLYGIAGGAGVVITSFPALIVSRLLFGVGAAAVFSGTTVALLSLYRGKARDRVMGWRTTATSLGGLAWPLLGGALGGISWHATFSIYLVGIPIAIAAIFTLPNTRADDAQRNNGGVIRLLRQRPKLFGFYGLMVSMALLTYAMAVFLPQRLAEIGIRAPLLVSIYAVVGGAVMASLIGLVYAKLRERLGYAALLRIAATAWMIGFLIYGTVSQPVVMLIAPLLLGGAQGILLPAITVLIDETAGPQLRAKAAALGGTAIFAGQFASPLILGPLIDATTTTTGFLASAAFAAVVLIVLLVVRVSTPATAIPEPAVP